MKYYGSACNLPVWFQENIQSMHISKTCTSWFFFLGCPFEHGYRSTCWKVSKIISTVQAHTIYINHTLCSHINTETFYKNAICTTHRPGML